MRGDNGRQRDPAPYQSTVDGLPMHFGFIVTRCASGQSGEGDPPRLHVVGRYQVRNVLQKHIHFTIVGPFE